MLLVLAGVEHVRGADGGQRCDEEQEHQRLALEHRDDHEAEAAIREPSDEREDHRLDPLAGRLAPTAMEITEALSAKPRREATDMKRSTQSQTTGFVGSGAGAGNAVHEHRDRLRLRARRCRG